MVPETAQHDRAERTTPKFWTMRDALREANVMLKEEFGDVDQGAAVQLATFLFTAQERMKFLRREEGPGDVHDVE